MCNINYFVFVLFQLRSSTLNNSQLNSGPLTASDLMNGAIQYQHDDSDTIHDQIQLSLVLEPGEVVLCNVTIPIIIKPINDRPFELITPAPHLTVVQVRFSNAI